MYKALGCFRESGRQKDLICGLVVPQGKVKFLTVQRRLCKM